MDNEEFVNQKLEFVEELVQDTDSHIFLTGKAGTGKTTFLRNLTARTYKRMVVVAPTGVAAINAGGVTIHSFFQLPFGPQIPDAAQTDMDGVSANVRSLASQFQKINRTKLKIMRSLDLLVIDEISMVRADVLDAIDAVLRRARRSQKPFGGVQLLMIGDVQQLAPVAKQDEWELLEPYYDSVYFFSSLVWRKTSYVCIELDHIYRQQDRTFIELLNKIRTSTLDKACADILNTRYDPDFDPPSDKGYITLTTHNFQADDINQEKLAAIKGKTLHFKAKVNGVFLENSYPTKEDLELKIGAQVMFVKNDPSPEKMFYNGKIGVLVSYDSDKEELMVRCDDITFPVTRLTWQNMEYSLDDKTNEIKEEEIGSFEQIPLRLAWAITIHKSQGLTFDRLVIDAGKAFAHGQVYVALSRCTSLEGLVLKTKITPNTLKDDAMVSKFVSQMPEMEPTPETVNSLCHDYELASMLDLFDFSGIYSDFGRLMKTITENDGMFDNAVIVDLSGRRQTLSEEIIEVAAKFARQIESLHAACPSCADNAVLQKRIKDGVAYFMTHFNSIVDNLFDVQLDTDNEAVNSQVREIMKAMKEAVYLKRSCLDACKDGFNVRNYHETKSVKILEAEKQSGIAALKRKSASNMDPLLAKLLAWRQEKAEETGMNTSGIVSLKSLKAIAKAKPVTLADLKALEGMGLRRVKRYGAELIDIVLRAEGQTFISMTEEIPRRNTYEITKDLFDEGKSPQEIAQTRGLALATIYNHLTKMVEQGLCDASDIVEKDKYDEIVDYFTSTEDPRIGAAIGVLGDDYDYGEVKVVKAEFQRNGLLPPDDE